MKPALPRSLRAILNLAAGTLAAGAIVPTPVRAAGAAPGIRQLETVVISATRTPLSPEQVASSLRLLDADALRHAPTTTLDGALRGVPGFSLFRRSDSFTANPTAQGVSLRGLGPSGASRSLVLLDGVPLNDPFGGWVAWTKLPREGLGHTEIVPGGGATAWGNAALGGVVHMFSAPVRAAGNGTERAPAGPGTASARGSLRLAATLGDYGTRSGEIAATVPARVGTLQVLARDFATDGFRLVASERRGSIDIPAWSRHRWLTARWHQTLAPRVELLATARYYEEKRGNGTPYQRNGSREKFASVELNGTPADAFTWHATAYAQDQTFASTFSSVNATRTAETPASDQFAVPATAYGAAWTGAWTHAPGIRTSFGADGRAVRGETREHFTFTNGNFTRLRVAGGRQAVGGVFLLHEHRLVEDLRATIGARLDGWRETDGHRRESDRATGVASRDERYADRDGTSFSPSAGLLWTPASAWRLRTSAQRGFRRPTLNELYRPFRVGPNITEANAALGTEKVTSAEAGIEWTLHHASEPANAAARRPLLMLGATGFTSDLRDAVGNVTLARGPGTYPPFGFIAAGGVGRQRLNLERIRVRGWELSARWAPTGDLTVSADYLYDDAVVRRSSLAPGIVGNRLAQVPRHSAALGARWRGPGGVVFTPRMRWIGQQFEDDENRLRLGEFVVADLGVSRALTPHVEVFLAAENLGHTRIETGRTADGIVNTGTPRLVLGGLRGSW